jgi:hypothetical protein
MALAGRNLTAYGNNLALCVLKASAADLPGVPNSPEVKLSWMSQQIWKKT